jgi:hypothetical protein
VVDGWRDVGPSHRTFQAESWEKAGELAWNYLKSDHTIRKTKPARNTETRNTLSVSLLLLLLLLLSSWSAHAKILLDAGNCKHTLQKRRK